MNALEKYRNTTVNSTKSLKFYLTELVARDGFRRYLLNTSWMLTEQLLRLLASFFVGIYIARYLGPANFGSYSYAIAFVTLFGAVAKLGLDGIVVRDLVNEPARTNAILGTAFWLKMVGALAAILLVASAVSMLSIDADSKKYIYIITSGLVFQSFEVVDFYFQSKVMSKFVSMCRLVSLACSSLLKLYLVYVGADLGFFVVVAAADQAVLAFSFMFAYIRRRLDFFVWIFDSSLAKHLLSSSWPLVMSGLSVAFYMRIDQIMIREMLGERAVGLYSAAVRLSEVWYVISSILVSSLFPAVLAAKNNSVSSYNQRLQSLYSLVVWAALLVATPVSLIANRIVVTLYGADFHGAGTVLALHVWTGVFVAFGIASERWLISENLFHISMLRTILGGMVNFVLNLILIPNHGIVGAAIATLAAQVIAAYLFDLFSAQTRVAFWMKTRSFLPSRAFV